MLCFALLCASLCVVVVVQMLIVAGLCGCSYMGPLVAGSMGLTIEKGSSWLCGGYGAAAGQLVMWLE